MAENIVVTGFGIFRDHELNPSWEAIRDGRLQIDRPNINIITREVRVSYKDVDREVEQLWQFYKPSLMVHVGLAAFEKSIRLEERARHGPFLHDDIIGEAPHKDLRFYPADNETKATGALEENYKRHCYSCKPCQFDCSQTGVNLDRVCYKLNNLHAQGEAPIPFKCSDDAGLYVCEYIYQKSLKISDRTVFIHVPNTGGEFKLEDIQKSLRLAIEFVIDELNEID